MTVLQLIDICDKQRKLNSDFLKSIISELRLKFYSEISGYNYSEGQFVLQKYNSEGKYERFNSNYYNQKKYLIDKLREIYQNGIDRNVLIKGSSNCELIDIHITNILNFMILDEQFDNIIIGRDR